MYDHVLRQVSEHLPMAVSVTDAEGRVLWVNAQMVELCGHSPEELFGKRPGEVLAGPATSVPESRRIGAALRKGESVSAELINYHADGHTYRVYLDILPIRCAQGRVERFISFQREIHSHTCDDGVVTVCMFCKSTRHSNNRWMTPESYLTDGNLDQVSHGICPKCTHHWTDSLENESKLP